MRLTWHVEFTTGPEPDPEPDPGGDVYATTERADPNRPGFAAEMDSRVRPIGFHANRKDAK